MSAKLVGWAWEQDAGSPTRKLVLVALADHANGHTGECFPNIARIADETELSYRTVQRALADLEAAGLISRERQRRADGSMGGYVYTFPPQDTVSGSPPVRVSGSPEDTVSGLREEPEVDLEPEVPPISPPGPMGQILASAEKRHIAMSISVWETHAPPLIAHRTSYFGEEATRRAIARALRRYGVEDVSKAITNYAIVLGGNEYRWSHRWTLIEFLKRGLDRFVPEAQPLENFRIRSNGQKFGRRDVSAAEMLAAADRLERAGEQKEIERGAG